MSDIIRNLDDFPDGVVINMKNAAGETVQVDKDEYEELAADKNITYPTGHQADAMTLGDCFPGYVP
jgi:hypothetical protein